MKSASSSQDLDFGVTVQLNCAVASDRYSLVPVAGRFSLLSPNFAQVSFEYCTQYGLAPRLAPVTSIVFLARSGRSPSPIVAAPRRGRTRFLPHLWIRLAKDICLWQKRESLLGKASLPCLPGDVSPDRHAAGDRHWPCSTGGCAVVSRKAKNSTPSAREGKARLSSGNFERL